MNPHLVFLIYTLSAVSGVVGLAYYSTLYLHSRSVVTRHYLVFLVSYSMMIFCATTSVYLSIHFPASALPLDLFISGVIVSCCALAYSLPTFIYAAWRQPLNGFWKYFYQAALWSSSLLVAAHWLLRGQSAAFAPAAVSLGLFATAFVQSQLYAWRHREAHSQSPAARRWFIAFAVFTTAVAIGEGIFAELIYHKGVVLSLPLIYLAWNLISLFMGITDQPDPSAFLRIPAMLQAFDLTQREQLIAQQILQGRVNKEIATDLRISPHTVKNHIYNIFHKLNVQNRIELIRKLQPPPR